MSMKPFGDVLEKDDVIENNNTAMQEAMKAVFSTNDIQVKSDLKETQIIPILKLYMFDDIYGCDITSKIADKFLTLAISKNRQSRKEFVELARNTITNEQSSIMGGVFGLNK